MKRDLCKLMRVDKAYSEVKKKPKSINVRPGLALGVITLQVVKLLSIARDCKRCFVLRLE